MPLRAGVGLWVCGCVGVWVCGCVGVWVCGCVGVWVCGFVSLRCFIFGEVLRCPHKRIITITKVYIARNNIHLEMIRFHTN